jgi:hypothetical protein
VLLGGVIRSQRVCGRHPGEPGNPTLLLGFLRVWIGDRIDWRGRSACDTCGKTSRRRGGEFVSQTARAIRANCKPQARPAFLPTDLSRWGAPVFPSLRAHKTNPAGRDPRGPCRRITSNCFSCSPQQFLNRLGAMQELILLFNDIPTPWIEARQLTNLRMRTFIATPSVRNVNNTEDPP